MVLSKSSSLKISEIMTRNPVVIRKGSTVSDAAAKMKQYNVGSAPVLLKKKVVGFFTGDDMVFKVLAEGKNPKTTLIDDVMVEDIVSLKPDASVQEAMEAMSEHEIKRLPIIDYDQQLVGYITIKDILRIEPTMADIAVERLRFAEEKRQSEIEKYLDDDDLLEGI
ncbi:MAG: CBS domain-containing protein [Nanobdellota archaeon]